MKEKIKNLVKKIIFSISCKKYILFESVPDFSDNSRAVFDEMIKRGWNNKYTFVWMTHDSLTLPKNISQDNIMCKKMSIVKQRYYIMKAKAIVCCNCMIWPYAREQFSIYLDHGTRLKNAGRYIPLPSTLKYYLSSSFESASFRRYMVNLSESTKVICLGFPRNDVFSKPAKSISDFFEKNFNKIIIWYPTFRQQKNTNRFDGGNALPIIHNTEWARLINDCLLKNNMLLVLKPHFAQDLKYLTNLQLSNIITIDDSFYPDHNISAYEFLNACDALITDYSSVYFDYLLCNKPVGLIWEDIADYKKGCGLVDNYEYLCKGGEKIYTADDFVGFLNNVSLGVDLLKNERAEICKWANYSEDGRNTERVVDFIVEKARL